MTISSVSNTYATQQAYGVQKNNSSAITGSAQSDSTSISGTGDSVSISDAAYQALQEAIKAKEASNNASSTQTNSSQGSAANNTMTASSDSSTSSTSTPMTMTQIAQQYDVTNMSPQDMVSMANQLYNSGHISAGEAIGLTAGPVLMLNNASITSNSASNGSPIHFVDGLSSDPSNSSANTNYLLEWQTKTAFDHQNGTTMDYSSDNQLTSLMSTLANLRQSSSSFASTVTS